MKPTKTCRTKRPSSALETIRKSRTQFGTHTSLLPRHHFSFGPSVNPSRVPLGQSLAVVYTRCSEKFHESARQISGPRGNNYSLTRGLILCEPRQRRPRQEGDLWSFAVSDTSTLGKNKNPSSPDRSRTYDLPITSLWIGSRVGYNAKRKIGEQGERSAVIPHLGTCSQATDY